MTTIMLSRIGQTQKTYHIFSDQETRFEILRGRDKHEIHRQRDRKTERGVKLERRS